MAYLHVKTLLHVKCLPPYDRPTIVSCKSNLPIYHCLLSVMGLTYTVRIIPWADRKWIACVNDFLA